MTNKNKSQSVIEKLQNTEVSLVTGTLALATAFLAALSVIPTVESETTTLLQASVLNIAGL